MRHSTPILFAVLAMTGVAVGQGIVPADVSFTTEGAVETSLTGQAGDAINGRVVMTTRGKGNCIACHEVSALKDFPFHGEVGPSLDGVAGHYSEADFRGIVSNAKMTFEGTVMPSFFKNSGYIRPGLGYTGKAAAPEDLQPILTAQEVEDVVAYLLTLTE